MLLSLSSVSAFAAGTSQMQQGEDNAGREFVMSCTYGVMAGTLVGAASLAFTSKPSDNLNRVARGASIGLYAGILLGLYVIYIVPGLEEGAQTEDPMVRLPVMVTPLFASANTPGKSGLKFDGLKADWTLLRF
jgi:hypothetical protein